MKRQRLEERIESRERIENWRHENADLKHEIQRLKDKLQTLQTDHVKDIEEMKRSFAFEKTEHKMMSIRFSRRMN
jgi:acetyl-CoA carboxylase alpha subunit